jgi:hypothetical protein
MAAIGTTVPSTLDPAFVQLKIGEADLRYALAGYAQPAPGSVMSFKSGVFAGGSVAGTTLGDADHSGMRVTLGATGANPTVLVNIGNCLIDTPGQGPYLCGVDSQKTIALANPSATQRRLDLIVARVYDDRNTAIASPANDRRFVIQAVTGDNTPGTPVLPTSTLPPNGWIPLASVLVEANGATLTITNLRGPGLVARGGRRILYGADAKITSAAFLEAGAYAGDQRYVVGHPFPNQTYYVSSDAGTAGWRGDGGRLVYTKYVPNSGVVDIDPVEDEITQLVSVTIPAFGIPVTLIPRFHWKPTLSGGQLLELGTRINGSVATNEHITTAGWSSNREFPKQVPDGTFGPYTASKNVDAYVQPIVTTGASLIQFDSSESGPHALQVVVEPANIDSSKVWL